LKRSLAPDEFGIFFGTAHPAKFKEQVENILGSPIPLPPALAACAAESGLSVDIAADFSALEQVIRTLKRT
ncbi:TPA: threonine synthase, partial [Candidatus Azambacteria bacterium]|nr:threonine synthase [Candidatus Azambacteria bacterium]